MTTIAIHPMVQQTTRTECIGVDIEICRFASSTAVRYANVNVEIVKSPFSTTVQVRQRTDICADGEAEIFACHVDPYYVSINPSPHQTSRG